MNYYNENDKFDAAWLRALIDAGLIPDGYVDERDIREVSIDDLKGYNQCHWFAGIGGWSKALAIAGWSTTRSIWTASCPCQPVSLAGLRAGEKDKRHLWPILCGLICKSLPQLVIGEQVATGDGKEWVDGVLLDLESLGYAVATVGLCCASVKAPHNRPRFFWLADLHGNGCNQAGAGLPPFEHDGALRSCANYQSYDPWGWFEPVLCSDGRTRRIEPGLIPLVNGFPGRMELLRGYGNAINPWVGAMFIRAFMDLNGMHHKGEIYG